MTERSETGPPVARVDEVEPEDFLRALLKISPEDAADAREDAARAMEKRDGGHRQGTKQTGADDGSSAPVWDE